MGKESFLLVSLKEDKAKKLAQVVSNDSCRKILDYLAEGEGTESHLSEKLDIPISTVHYNLQQLVKAGLVSAEEYHYSKKGKEIIHYKLANKFIIIAPKSTFGFKEKLRNILPVALFIGAGTAVIQAFSGLFAKGAMTNIFTESKETLVRETVLDKAAAPKMLAAEALEEAEMEGSSAVAQRVSEDAASTTGGALNEKSASEAVNVAADEVAKDMAEEFTRTTSEKMLEPVVSTSTSYVPPTIWANIALWFFIGAVSTLVVYLTFTYFKNKKR